VWCVFGVCVWGSPLLLYFWSLFAFVVRLAWIFFGLV